MTDQLTPLVERLSEAPSPYELRNWEKKDGYYVSACRVSKDDVPQLINIAAKWIDLDWPDDDLGPAAKSDTAEMLPVTAWRTLADLKAEEAVEPLVDVLSQLDDEYDDWASSELPHVFGKIGAAAIEALDQLANDCDKPEFIRTIAAEALRHVAQYHPQSRDQVLACLTEMMTNASEDDIHFNSNVLVGLVDLRAVDAAEAIERAFAGNCLDVGMLGDWEYVRRKLGVKGLGLEMPKQPYNSVEQFRRRMGIGVFSKEPIFNLDGEPTDAEDNYNGQAWALFSKSEEAEQVVEQFGELRWFQTLLEFGINYRGEIVDEMTLAGVREFVLDYVPRKVSTESDQAASIVFELAKFWEYLDRVFELPEAKAIVQWLKSDGLVAELETELSNPENFGMAKSMFMTGQAAGFDMTSEAGMAQFVAAYNQSILDSTSAPPSRTSGRQRVGRNDPCPCGSGKKYKKCCRTT